MITIYFLRHAETRNNATQEKIGGRSNDIALSEAGEEQAKKARDWFKNQNLPLDGIACSSAHRAKQTIEDSCGRWCNRLSRNEILYTDALNEVCQGDWEGQPRAEVLTPTVLSRCVSEAPYFRAPKGETHKEAEERMMGFIQSHILDKFDKGTFLLVGHGLSFKCLLQGIMGLDPKITYKIGCGNASLSRLRYEKSRGWFVDYINRDISSEILPTKSDPYADDIKALENPIPLPLILHIRKRPGMYIGKLGDGAQSDDGIYILTDIALWFANQSSSKRMEFIIDGDNISICYYGTPTPFKLLNGIVTEMYKDGKWNGRHDMLGLLAINSLSSEFTIGSIIGNECKEYSYEAGVEVRDILFDVTKEEECTYISYTVDKSIFGEYSYNLDHLKALIHEFTYLNVGVEIIFNGTSYRSENGMLDFLNYTFAAESLYPPIHLKGDGIDIALTHNSTEERGESYEMFANGFRVRGGTLVSVFRSALPKVINEIYDFDYHKDDVLESIYAAVSIEIDNPTFMSSTKWNLTSKDVRDGLSIAKFLEEFLRDRLKKYFTQHPQTTELLLGKIKRNKELRKSIEINLAKKEIELQRLKEWEKEHGIETSDVYLHKGPSDLKAYTIPNHITLINKDAFKDCEMLEELTLSTVLRDIDDSAFPQKPKFKLKIHRDNRHLIWNLLVRFGADNIEIID